MQSITNKLFNWYFSKQALPYWVILLFDSTVVLLSNLLVFELRSVRSDKYSVWDLFLTILCYLVPYIIGFRIMKTYRGVMRYSSFSDLIRIGFANLIGIVLIWASRKFLDTDRLLVPIGIIGLLFAWLLSTLIMVGIRIIVKHIYDTINIKETAQRVFIYGTKAGGIALAKSIRVERPSRFILCGFISDSKDMPGHILQGVKVYPNDSKLIENMKRMHATALLVSPLKTERISKNDGFSSMLIDSGIKLYILGEAEVWDGKTNISTNSLHQVQIEDLLPRDEIQLDLDAVKNLLNDRRILITGSAGSIGSEMVRQIAQWNPSCLILIDQAETPQHDIHLKMAKDFPSVKSIVLVADITNAHQMESIFSQYRPEYVFHAAAYKHVPMMEDVPCMAVQNNVGGTRVLADLSVKYGVKKFVMISTDKAVNPTNVMGCSKRICEMYVQSLDNAIKDGNIKGETQFVTTRFGNVLGSNGSVIPLFRKQIENGGPVTVTHPDIIRFFMLIPEACKLVLEAGTMGKGGEIFVFDMGKPVKIVDLAKRMILLSGAKNIEIEFTGLRKGEKLYEEVLADEEITKPTFNDKIKIAQVREIDYDEINKKIDNLIKTSYLFDNMETVKLMKDIVPEYKSQNSLYSSIDNKE